jgi:hypothetical protein
MDMDTFYRVWLMLTVLLVVAGVFDLIRAARREARIVIGPLHMVGPELALPWVVADQGLSDINTGCQGKASDQRLAGPPNPLRSTAAVSLVRIPQP